MAASTSDAAVFHVKVKRGYIIIIVTVDGLDDMICPVQLHLAQSVSFIPGSRVWTVDMASPLKCDQRSVKLRACTSTILAPAHLDRACQRHLYASA